MRVKMSEEKTLSPESCEAAPRKTGTRVQPNLVGEIGDVKEFKKLLGVLTAANVKRLQYRSIEIEFSATLAEKAQEVAEAKVAEEQAQGDAEQAETTYDPFTDFSAANHAETLDTEILGTLE
jgi:hypothetical protein